MIYKAVWENGYYKIKVKIKTTFSTMVLSLPPPYPWGPMQLSLVAQRLLSPRTVLIASLKRIDFLALGQDKGLINCGG